MKVYKKESIKNVARKFSNKFLRSSATLVHNQGGAAPSSPCDYAKLDFQVSAEKSPTKKYFTASDLVSYKENETIRVLFLFMAPTIWPSMESVWKICQQDKRFCAKVVLLPCEYQDRRLSQLTDAHKLLISKEIPFFYGETFSIEKYKPHVVFVPVPYLDMLPKEYSIEKILQHGGRIVYIPYGLEIGGGGFNTQYQFNLQIHQIAWRVFARSERHRKMFSRYCSSGGGNVVVTGHPRLDLIHGLKGIKLNNIKLEEKIANRLVILWTPHFSVGKEPGWSTFEKFSENILSEFEARTNLFLIIRPHPLLFNKLKETGLWSHQDQENFISRIENSHNMVLDKSISYHDAFTHSDALMADAGSFLLEYLATEKPLLFLEHPNNIGLNDDRNVVDIMYRSDGSNAINKFLDLMANKKDPMKRERINKIPEYLYNIDGNAGLRIINHIFEAIKNKDDFYPKQLLQSQPHKNANTYWTNSTNTYLAAPEYYDRQESEVKRLLAQFPLFEKGLDVGCGDGRFTLVIASYVRHITGIDISDSLIEQAKQRTFTAKKNNVEWRKESLEKLTCSSIYQFISCLGVLSGFIDETLFIHAITQFRALLKPNGILLTKESLSYSYPQKTDSGSYVAIYRNINDYLHAIQSQGFKLKQKIILGEDKDKGLLNVLCLFERRYED